MLFSSFDLGLPLAPLVHKCQKLDIIIIIIIHCNNSSNSDNILRPDMSYIVYE